MLETAGQRIRRMDDELWKNSMQRMGKEGKSGENGSREEFAEREVAGLINFPEFPDEPPK